MDEKDVPDMMRDGEQQEDGVVDGIDGYAGVRAKIATKLNATFNHR